MIDTPHNNTTVSVEYALHMNNNDTATWIDGNYTIQNDLQDDTTGVKPDVIKHEMIMSHILIPGVCSFGLLGNLLALVVLLSRMCEGIELLEQGSLFSMIGKTVLTQYMQLPVQLQGKFFYQSWLIKRQRNILASKKHQCHRIYNEK